MKNYPNCIKNTLNTVIRDMAKHPEDFCRNPKTDFTRKRKLPFEKVLTLLVKMGGHSLRDEMLDCLDFKEMPASVSALAQQRSKILPEGEFDVPIQVFLTRKQTKEVKTLAKEKPGTYRFLPSKSNFALLSKGSSDFYSLSFRIVRFRISEDSTETLITNLDKDSFPVDELKSLYHLRWGIETSFRQLKYTIGLNLFQSKVEYITQEVFARLTVYNFCELITSHVVIQNKRRKYVYQTNFTASVHICRQFLRGAVSPPKVEALIEQQVVPIRPGRSTPRKTKNIKFNGFFYGIA